MASFAAEFSLEVIEKLLIGTASGWLQRLVRPLAKQPPQHRNRDCGKNKSDEELVYRTGPLSLLR